MIERLPGLEPKERMMLSQVRLVMVICVLLLVANLLVGLAVWRLPERIERLRTPISVSCSGSRSVAYRQLPLAVAFGVPGTVGHEPLIAPDLTASGQVRAEFSFRATTKEPGSRYFLRYRVGEGAWQEVAAEEVGPLQFAAAVELAAEPEVSLSYQAVARLGGEAIAASDIGQTRAEWLGSPHLQVNLRDVERDRQQGVDRATLVFWQADRPVIEDWQIVGLKVNAVYAEHTVPLEIQLEEGHQFVCFVPNLSFRRLELEAEYGDGLVVEGEVVRADLYHRSRSEVLKRPRVTGL